MKCNCMMGLFPEIGRAWLTIDSDIYVSVKFNPHFRSSLTLSFFAF